MKHHVNHDDEEIQDLLLMKQEEVHLEIHVNITQIQKKHLIKLMKKEVPQHLQVIHEENLAKINIKEVLNIHEENNQEVLHKKDHVKHQKEVVDVLKKKEVHHNHQVIQKQNLKVN